MITDPRTGTRSIRAARETFAAAAILSLCVGTVLRGLEGQAGGIAGAILTLIALAVVSRYQVSWDETSITLQTPFGCRRSLWSEFSGYRLEPEYRSRHGVTTRPTRSLSLVQTSRLRLFGRGNKLTIGLAPYCWQDIRHLTDRVCLEVPEHETHAALVS